MFIFNTSFKIGDCGEFIYMETQLYVSATLGTIIIPAGFSTDFVTLPAPFRPFFTPNGRHRLAAGLHDYLYSVKGRYNNKCAPATRKEADKEFYIAMKKTGVKPLTRKLFYLAVRVGGWWYWTRASLKIQPSNNLLCARGHVYNRLRGAQIIIRDLRDSDNKKLK